MSEKEEELTKKLFNFLMFLHDKLEKYVPDDVMQEVASRFRKLGDELKEEILRLSTDVETLLKDNEVVRSELDKVSRERDELKKKLEEMSTKYEEIMREKGSFDEKVAQIREEKSRLEEELENIKSQLEEIEMERDATKNELRRALEENERLNEQIKQLKEQIEELQEKKERLETILERMEADLRWAANRLKDEVSDDLAKFRDEIRGVIYELRALLRAGARAKLERIGTLVSQMYSKLRSKDFGAALVRLLKERKGQT